MSNRYLDYHNVYLLRLLSMVILFGVILPGLCLLFMALSRLAERMTAKPPITRHQPS